MDQTISFCIAPHQDDWLLFYGRRAYADRTVFIYITAGDAGRSDSWWETREKAALAASRELFRFETLTQEIVFINGHPVTKYTQAKSASYFLRLPDGLPDGAGTALHGYQSLTKLQKGKSAVATVDGLGLYTSWEDLCKTLAELIRLESQSASLIQIHAPEYDSSLNFNDHADHKATADAILKIAKGHYQCFWWLAYCTYYYPPNLSEEEIELKRRLFLAYSKETGAAPDESEWICWKAKAYCRPDGYLQLQHFDPKQLLDKTTRYQQCGEVLEEKSESGLCIANQLTQKNVALNRVAEILWNVLKSPCTADELAALLGADDKTAALESVHSLLESLLNAKLIRGI